MPSYYAHFQFGALVLERLPEPLRRELSAQRAAFDLGCLGPDPLFFYRPWALKNPARDEALRIHRAPGRVPLGRLRRAAEEGGPMAAGAAAGFLCHYALDAACHGCVLDEAAKGRYGHQRLEAGLDRLLMKEAGYKTPRLAGFPPSPREEAVYRAASAAYAHTGAEALRRGYRAMSLDARLLARLWGRGSAPVSLRLRAMLEDAVAETAEQTVRFFAGEPLGSWYDRDFYGRARGPGAADSA